MNTNIYKCDSSDLEELRELAIQTYDETFHIYNSPENMSAYLEKAFNRNQLLEELNNPFSKFFLLYVEEKAVAYLKTNEKEAQTDVFDPDSLEIERIYVKQEYQRSGLGRKLIEVGIGLALKQHLKYVWLGVWEHNTKALKFYRNIGFKKFGSHEFIMGDDHQIDILLKKFV